MARGRGVAARRGAGRLASSSGVVAGFHIGTGALIAVAYPSHSGTGHCWHRDYID